MTAWPPRDSPPHDPERERRAHVDWREHALRVHVARHPIPDAIHLMFLRNYDPRHPRFPSPDQDPTHGGRWDPIGPVDHCRQILIAYYETRETRWEVADSCNMPVEYFEALERYLGVSLDEEV